MGLSKTQVAAAIGEVKAIAPHGVILRAEAMSVAAVLCSQEKTAEGYSFAVARTTSGPLVAVWENHAFVAADKAALIESYVLNKHERTLLEYGVGSDA